jgi:hypothetical protein
MDEGICKNKKFDEQKKIDSIRSLKNGSFCSFRQQFTCKYIHTIITAGQIGLYKIARVRQLDATPAFSH